MSDEIKAKRLFRCRNHPKPIEFWHEKGVCAVCGSSHEEDDDCVQKLEIVHFNPPSGRPNKGLNIRACDGKAWNHPEGTGRSSGDVTFINCPLCLETTIYKQTVLDLASGEINQVALAELLKKKDAASAAVIVAPGPEIPEIPEVTL